MITFTNLLIGTSFCLGFALLVLVLSSHEKFFVVSLLGSPSFDTVVTIGEKYGLVRISTDTILYSIAYYSNSIKQRMSLDDRKLRYFLSSFDRDCIFTLNRDTFSLSCNDLPVHSAVLKTQAGLMSSDIEALSNNPVLHSYIKSAIAALSKQSKRAGYKGVLCTGALCGIPNVLHSDILLFIDHRSATGSETNGRDVFIPASAALITGDTEAQILRQVLDELARSKILKREQAHRFTVLRPKMGVLAH